MGKLHVLLSFWRSPCNVRESRKIWAGALVLCVVFAFVLGTTAFMFREIGASTFPPPRFVAISASGEVLDSLFEGLEPNPLYSNELMMVVNRNTKRCGFVPSVTTAGFFSRLFDVPTVYAQCIAAECAGSYWIQIIDSCDTGGGCGGWYSNTEVDYGQGDPCSGTAPSGDHCGGACECGAVWVACMQC